MPKTSEAQKKAIQAYKERNREKINAQARKDYEKLKADPERLERHNEKRRARVQKYKTAEPNIDAEFIEAFI